MIRYSKVGVLFCLATFSLIGYQNCMGQKVDLSSSTPGAAEALACAPSTSDLSTFASAQTDMQTNCVICHADTSNTASAVFRLYTTAGDASAESDNLCSLQGIGTSTALGMITTSPIHPFRATTTDAPSLLAYLQSH